MKQLRTSFALALAISVLAVACGPSSTPTPSGSGAISNEPFVMLSTQFNTVTESEAVRKQILAGFTIAPVDFLGSAAGPFVDRITAETKTAKGQVGVIGNVGHSVLRFHQDQLTFLSIGKISALPTVTKGTMGARWRSAILTNSSRPNFVSL